MKRLLVIILVTLLALASLGCTDKSLKFYNLGIAAAEREEYERAIGYWRESLEYRSTDPETRYNIGLALLNLERYPEAEIEFRKALEHSENDHEILYGLGRSLEMQGELVEAKNLYERSINLKPNFAPAHLGLASISLATGQYRSAENQATTALTLDPSNIEGNKLLAEALFRQNNYREAYAQLQSAKNLAPLDPGLYLLIGKVAYARHMYRDALAALTQARSLGASNDEVYLYLGLTLFNLDDLDDAETNLKLSLFKDNRETQALQGLGRIYTKRKEWDKALDAFESALAVDPADETSILGLSFVLMNTGRFEEAITMLERLRSRPDPPAMTFYYLGHAYMRAEMFDRAAESFKTFMEVWDGDARLLDEVSGIIQSLGG